ncbi:tumor necrosis factor receptor superfamily member 14-like isoform X2 [Hemiscyllium ocellatum]|uniref:tumor necrosis factor receptor superfamily member 14-like isoform X2 n=1 Tax=Hemiscyllium ocellatum TaxID=170820 RepID=UPI0029664A75|nr:tumor necrosis factor receptor superfamily member 14-like isoform X2 [Hemiscyllium ocellatum]
MVHVPISAEKLNIPAAIPLGTILLGCLLGWISSYCEEGSGRKVKILFIILLMFRPHLVISCGVSEYDHEGHCCSMCSPGSIVLKHCTELFGTTCKPCTAGEFMEHPNGLDKCFKCKPCDPELGFEVKHPCIYTRNTECKPKNGYYCRERNCPMAFEHKTCPPGEGVKEKGTQFKDTVCEACPEGTYSSNDSSTEPCVEWTQCVKHKQKQVRQGTSTSDAECEEESNLLTIILPLVSVILVVLFGGFSYFICRRKKMCASDPNRLSDHKEHRSIPESVGLVKSQAATSDNDQPDRTLSLSSGKEECNSSPCDSGIGSQNSADNNSPHVQDITDTQK